MKKLLSAILITSLLASCSTESEKTVFVKDNVTFLFVNKVKVPVSKNLLDTVHINNAVYTIVSK